MMDRPLRPVEITKLNLGINLMISFEVDSNLFKIEHLIKAIHQTCLKHPYLRMKIIKDDNSNGYKFVEKTQTEMSQYEQIKWTKSDLINDLSDWQKRFNLFTSINYDISKSVFHIEIDEFINSKYRMYFSINHSGKKSKNKSIFFNYPHLNSTI